MARKSKEPEIKLVTSAEVVNSQTDLADPAHWYTVKPSSSVPGSSN